MKPKDLHAAATLLRALQSQMGASREKADPDSRRAWDEIDRLAPALDRYADSYHGKRPAVFAFADPKYFRSPADSDEVCKVQCERFVEPVYRLVDEG